MFFGEWVGVFNGFVCGGFDYVLWFEGFLEGLFIGYDNIVWIVGVFWFFFCVEVIEIVEEFIEFMIGW